MTMTNETAKNDNYEPAVFIDREHEIIACPVCGNPVETENVCQVCNWENTGDINIDGGPNHMTLAEAREAWKQGKPID